MAEFERIQKTIGNRTVLLTSWFDENTQTWRASAPAYMQLSEHFRSANASYSSRKAAVDRLSHLLDDYFTKRESSRRR